MDYGKLAYLKASDLEALMEKSRESDRGICCVSKENVAGSVSIGTCYGGTVIAFSENGTLDYYVGGVKVSSSGGFAAFNADGDVTVKGAADKLTVVMFNGEIQESQSKMFADELTEKSLVAYVINEDEPTLFVSADYDFAPVSQPVEGHIADVVSYNGEFVVVSVADGYIKVLGVTSGICRRFPFEADAVAALSGNFLTIAYLKNGVVKYFSIENLDDEPGKSMRIELSGVSDVRAVKGGDGFVLRAGGTCYIKRLSEANGGKDLIYVYTGAEVAYEQ
ncbi:MAG: hypothetical protein ACLU3R_04095 [Acutalibacteraceae bacterium]